ncbi:MAG: TonB family protein [Bryobacteraceae bacterium]
MSADEVIRYTLFGIALKSLAVLAAAWMIAILLRAHSAASRHLVWTAALASILVLPFLSLTLPALNVATPVSLMPASTAQFQVAARSAPEDALAAVPLTSLSSGPSLNLRLNWQTWLIVIWFAGCLASLVRMTLAWIHVYGVRTSAHPFRDRALCETLHDKLGIRRPVQIRVAETVGMPLTFGFLRPAVLLPAESADWPRDLLQVVLLHELAHVRRGDAAIHLLARMALAFYWWNPLAWRTWREFLKERERAADDLVLNAGAPAPEYAGHLLNVARSRQSPPAVAWAAIAMARPSQLEGRLLSILDPRTNRRAAGRLVACMAALVSIVLVLPLAAMRPQEQGKEAVLPSDVQAFERTARAQHNYRVLDDAAKAAVRLHKYALAGELLQIAMEIRGETAGSGSVEFGIGLLNIANLEEKVNPKVAPDVYAKAAQVLRERAQAAPALLHLGMAALGRKDYPAALDYFQRAQRLDPSRAGEAQMWTAIAQKRQGNTAEAERLFQDALSLQGGNSVEAAVTLELHALMLRDLGRDAEAGQLEKQAAVIQSVHGHIPVLAEGVHRVGQDIQAPTLVRKIEPDYTEEARVAGLQGTVIVQVVVEPDGFAHDGQIVRGLGLGLDENALEAISQWQFKPGTQDGQPVKVAATVEVHFRLL